jgi:hypothetical protein
MLARMAYFDLQNPDHAYTFGFLQADGHLYQGAGRKGRLSVELSERDTPILEAFRQLFPVSSSIRHRTRTTNFSASSSTAAWTVCALDFREEVQALGIPSGRKSDIVAPPTVPFSERDYLRGLIDADGSLGRTAKDLPFVALTTASERLIEFFCSYAERLTGMTRTARRNARDGVYNIVYTRETAVALAADLYYKGCLALPRKRAAAAKAVTWVRPANMRTAPQRRRWTMEEDQLLRSTPDDAAAALLLHRTAQSCAMRRWRLSGPGKGGARSARPRPQLIP